MASWIEIDRVRKDPAAFKPLAKRLLKDPSFERSEFADDFLENIINWKRDELTTRQGEILLELRDEAEIHYEFKGLSIPILIDKCFANRFDLDDGDRQRIQRLRESGKRYVTGGQMGWFKRICKQLDEMESMVHGALTLLRGLAFFTPSGLGIQDLGYLAFLKGLGVRHALDVGAAFVVVKRSKEIFWIIIGYLLLARHAWRPSSDGKGDVHGAAGNA